MRTKHLSIALGFILSAGLAIAQTPSQNQPDPAQQNAPASPLAAESAPSTQHRAPNPNRAAKRLGKQLGLSQDQVAQLRPILADRQQEMASVRSDTTMAPQDRRAKIHGIQQDSRNKIEALLTDSQKQQYEQMLQNRRAQHHEQPQAQ
jgi:periplasmic protein CpxP/Spy